MAQNVIINGVTYQSVPEVDIPKSGGGTVSISSTEQAKVIASNIKSGVTLLGVAGSLALPSISQDSTTKILSIS